MKVSNLEPNSKVINLVVEIESLEEPTITPTEQKVQEGIVSDDTGQVKISLWNEHVGVFKTGDKISMSSG